MMKNKYLKYHPYITREVFGDIINSLRKDYRQPADTDKIYNYFKSKFNYLFISPKDNETIKLNDTIIRGFTPISWTSILGKAHMLKLANEHYPRGTKYRHLKDHTSCQVRHEFIYYPTEDFITDGWGGCVYEKGVWANRIEQGTTVSHPECPALTTFPETGLCIDDLSNLQRLVQYLNDRPTRRADKLYYIHKETIGIAWNEASCWVIKEKSSKPNYSFSQLEKFISPKKPMEFKLYDWVMIKESELPIKDNWLGEGGKITHQGAYQITEIKDDIVLCLDNIECALRFTRFRLATQDEINAAIRLSKHEHYVNKLKQATPVTSHRFTEAQCIFGINSFDNPNQINVPKKTTIKIEVNQEVKINIPVKSKIKI